MFSKLQPFPDSHPFVIHSFSFSHSLSDMSLAILPVVLLSLLLSTVHADFTCNVKNSVPLKSLMKPVNSNSNSVPGTDAASVDAFNLMIEAQNHNSCTISGTCYRKLHRKDLHVRQQQAPSITCPNRMNCVTATANNNMYLYCVDLKTLDYIDQVGGCGNGNTKAYKAGCVQVKAANQQSGTATAVPASQTSSSSKSSTTTSVTNSAVSEMTLSVALLASLTTLSILWYVVERENAPVVACANNSQHTSLPMKSHPWRVVSHSECVPNTNFQTLWQFSYHLYLSMCCLALDKNMHCIMYSIFRSNRMYEL